MLALMEEMDEDEEVDWDALAIKVCNSVMAGRLMGRACVGVW